MDTNFDWIAEYYQWIKKNLSARRLKNGWTEIGTPFMDRHNDGLVIYAKRDGDSITLSDDGYIINDLIADFAQAIRAGYEGFKETDGYGEYSKFDLQERWSYELYLETLKDLFWRRKPRQ